MKTPTRFYSLIVHLATSLVLIAALLGTPGPISVHAGIEPDEVQVGSMSPSSNQWIDMTDQFQGQDELDSIVTTNIDLDDISVRDYTQEIKSIPLDRELAASILAAGSSHSFVTAAGGNWDETGRDAIPTSDGGYIVVGETDSFNGTYDDILVVKFTSNGTIAWAKLIEGSGFDEPKAIAQATDGGYFITGYTNTNSVSPDNDVMLIKLTNSGTLSWAKNAGGLEEDEGWDVAAAADGGCIVTGTTYSWGAGGRDIFTLKYTSSGTISWAVTAGGASGETGYAVIEESSGFIMVAGSTASYGAGGIDMLLIQYLFDGSVNVVRTIGNTGDEYAFDIQQVGYDYIIVGSTTSYFSQGGSDLMVIKLQGNWVINWARIAGGTENDVAYSVGLTSDNGFIVAGSTSSYGAGGSDALLLKYTQYGDLSWTRTIGGNEDEIANAVAQTGDGGYFLAGYTDTYGAGFSDFFLVKTDPNGNVQDCTICAPAAPIAFTPPMSTSSPSLTVSEPSLYTSSPVFSQESPPILTTQLCGQKAFMTVTGDGDENAFDVVQTSDGGYAVAGLTDIYGAGGNDALLLKYDASGQLEWARTAGGPASDQATALEELPDGGFIVAGKTYSFGAGGWDVLLMRYTGDGTLSWAKVAGGGNADYSRAVIRDYVGYFHVVGDTTSYGAGNYDIFLLRFKGDGTLYWAKTAGSALVEYAYGLIKSDSGSYYVVGETTGYGEGGRDVLVLKYANDGILEWAKTAGGVAHDTGRDLVEDQYGNIFVAGYTDSYGVGEDDVLLLKFASNGALAWSRVAGGADNDRADSIDLTSDGGVILAGQTDNFGAGDTDAWLLKYTQSGSYNWARTIGGAGWDVGYSVSLAADGGFAVTGFTRSYGTPLQNIFLAKTNPDGLIAFCEACAPANPTRSIPTLISSYQSIALVDRTISTSSVTPTTSAPGIGFGFVCGFPFDIFLPLAAK